MAWPTLYIQMLSPCRSILSPPAGVLSKIHTLHIVFTKNYKPCRFALSGENVILY